MRRLPEDFLLGFSTASYQIEGAVTEDGRGESIWDRFSHTPGKVAGGDTGDIACDHYHRWYEDVALLAEASADVYRFSIAWPRILPAGTGDANEAGLAFYDRLIDALLERHVEPWPCLYHWDLPQLLQDRGGWANREMVDWFGDYCEIVHRRLGDRISRWFLFNEPGVAAANGYWTGSFAPGVAEPEQWPAAAHHFNLATGAAAHRLRALGAGLVGTVVHLNIVDPDKGTAACRAAAERLDAIWHTSFIEPLFRGTYPEPVRSMIEPHIRTGDLETIHGCVDLVGLNYYTRFLARPDAKASYGVGVRFVEPGATPASCLGWEVYPDGLGRALRRMRDEFGNPFLLVTETGLARHEPDAVAQGLADPERIAFHLDHLDQVLDAIEEGSRCGGYLVWSLLDNFEWAKGYAPRFGLVHVDYASLKRTPKQSFAWFAQLARTRMLSPPAC